MSTIKKKELSLSLSLQLSLFKTPNLKSATAALFKLNAGDKIFLTHSFRRWWYASLRYMNNYSQLTKSWMTYTSVKPAGT